MYTFCGPFKIKNRSFVQNFGSILTFLYLRFVFRNLIVLLTFEKIGPWNFNIVPKLLVNL